MWRTGTNFFAWLCYNENVERRIRVEVKKVLSLLMLSTAIIGVGKVKAESNSEIYYTNPNGISLTEKEYNLTKTMFDEHFLEIMNQDE